MSGVKIVFRVDGSRELGMGHIQRCLALVKELRNIKIFFISRRNNVVKRKINQEGFEVTELKNGLSLKEDLKHTVEILNAKKIHVLITDLHEIDEQYLQGAKKCISLLVSIDDTAKTAFPSDILVNGNIYAKDLLYHSSTGKTRFYLGPQYIILRREFAHIGERNVNRKVKNILVTLGSTDPFNLTPKILNTLNGVNKNFKITAIIGRFFNNFPEVKMLSRKMDKEVNLVYDPPQMVKLMLTSDLAISGGGVTLYELAATGTPTLALHLADDQVRNVKAMSEAGVTINLGAGNKKNMNVLRKEIVRLMEDYKLRKKMSIRGRKLVDGNGAKRVAKIILIACRERKV